MGLPGSWSPVTPSFFALLCLELFIGISGKLDHEPPRSKWFWTQNSNMHWKMASGLDKKLNFNAKITQIGFTLIPGRNAFLHPSSHKPLTLSLFLPLPLYSQENSSNLNPWISQPSLDRFWWNLEDMSKIWSRIWFWHWNSRIPPKFHFVLVLKNFVLVLSSCSLASLKQLPYSPLLLFFFFSQLSSFGHTMLQADLLCACNSWPFFTSFSMRKTNKVQKPSYLIALLPYLTRIHDFFCRDS